MNLTQNQRCTELEALKEQAHRRALAFLETIRQQQNTPPGGGGPLGALGGLLGEQQIVDPSAAAAAAGLGPGKISNAGFASLQRNASPVADVNNSQALNFPFGGGQASTPARGLAQRNFGGTQTVSNQPANAAFSNSGDGAGDRGPDEQPDPFQQSDLNEGIDPNNEDAILVGDGVARIVASGGVDRKCYRQGDYSFCEVRYDPDSEPTGRVFIQRGVRGGRYMTMKLEEAPVGGKAICRASKDNPDGFCESIPGPNTPPEEPGEIIIEEIL